ncbi:hypothetical protein Stube_38620 [Streptomyces tubercidicus]|uniref:Uncharacterized protein n=1 Tax=Streptomyces tubercidicus TaxID=47759 RepID=A0A640UTQ3_9ACTN|nr:hypothetical protein Stube_38620 [Streptomyces tubercidicus]
MPRAGDPEPIGNSGGNRPSADVSEHVRQGGVTSGNGPGAGYGRYAVTQRTGPGFATVGSARKNQHAYGRFDSPRRRRGDAARGRALGGSWLWRVSFTPHGEVAGKWWSS